MDDRKVVGTPLEGLFTMGVWLLSMVLMIWSFFSLSDEPMKAVALAVLALYFQRAADGMSAVANRRERRERREETRGAA